MENKNSNDYIQYFEFFPTILNLILTKFKKKEGKKRGPLFFFPMES